MIRPIETARLIIRSFESDDVQAVHEYTSDAAVMTYIPGGPLSEEQVRSFLVERVEDQAKAVAVVLKAEDRLIGHMPFHLWYAPRTYEIGWLFNRRYYGQGYATEAAAALLRYGFETLGLHRMIATCQPENVASWRVMEKIGLRREGHFRQCIANDDGTWWDEYFYALLEEEWFSR